jgi:hypothetical protein
MTGTRGRSTARGTLTEAADAVFLRLYADDRLAETQWAAPRGGPVVLGGGAAPAGVDPVPGGVRHEGGRPGDRAAHRDQPRLRGCLPDFEGQSNALATDTGEKVAGGNPRMDPQLRPASPGNPDAGPANRWCHPVWKAEKGEPAELGWWGMELAKRLVASQRMPVFILNAAVGGTRIDQHQRQESDPTDLSTIYGRMLWRLRHAKLTHGIRAILWHQGENDQGADGPTGGYGWETYQPLFVELSAAWKRDFPNVRHYYVFQIWPNSCAMGGRNGSGDMLREKQRTLPALYSRLSVLSTLGVRPPGGCHFPLAGWGEFAHLVQPLIERDFYGRVADAPITPPNLRRASFVGGSKDAIALEFDQPVVWAETLASQFYLDGEKGRVVSGTVVGNVLMLQLAGPSAATRITYLEETQWSQDTLLLGANGLAALTFCNVPLSP